MSGPLILVIAVLVIGAAAAGGWMWWQNARPGATYLRQGMAAADMQQYALAEQDWLAGVHADPSYAPLNVRLGDLYMQQGRFSDAAAQYDSATRLSPQDSDLFLKLNRAQLAVGNDSAALAAAKRAAQLRPGDADAQGLLGILADNTDDVPDAMRGLTRAVALRPDDRDYFIHLMMLDMRISRMPAAHAALTQWLQKHPSDPMACHLLAVTDEHDETDPAVLQQALALETRARAGMPGDMRVYMTLGQLNLAAHKPADALNAYEDGLKIDPHSAEMLHGIARCATILGDTQIADATAKKLLMETTLHQQITHLGDQIGLTRNNGSLILQRARLEMADNNSAGAMADYRALLARNRNDTAARGGLKALYLHLHRPDLAKQAMDPAFMP